MQTPKLLVMSILAALLVSSALSVVAARDQTPTAPPTSTDSVTSANPPDQPPVEGNQSAPGVGDSALAPIYEHDGEPAFGIPANAADPTLPSSAGDKSTLIVPAPNPAPDNALPLLGVGVVVALVVGGVIGIVFYRKQAVRTEAEN